MTRELKQFKADIFQALAHPTRIAIAEALCQGELSVGELILQLELEPANASQHLSVLRAKNVVLRRKAGNQVFYSLRDPTLIQVLEILKTYFFSHLALSHSMLEELED